MKTIRLKIDSELYEWVAERSKFEGRAKSALIADALIAFRKHIQKNSVTTRAGDLVGKFNSGVTDRATNKKYMKDFGKWRR